MSQLFLNLSIPESNQTKPEESLIRGKKSIRTPLRNQVEFNISTIEDLLPVDHRARDVWDYVCQMDLSEFHDSIKVLDKCQGAPTTDPRVLMTLWLYGILEGIASARRIADLTTMHHAYIWICGGVSINYHTLSDFRTHHPDRFRKLLQESIALMWKTGLFKPDTAAQDGTRSKANSGTGSFRREASLVDLLKLADEHIDRLNKEIASNAAAMSQREKAAKERAVKERKERIEKAHDLLKKYKEEREESCKKNREKITEKELEDMRASTTDPECRKMKMGDGGYRPAYNVQFSTSTAKKVILGVDVVNTMDPGTLVPMMQNVKKNLAAIGCPMVKKWLVDTAYANKIDIDLAKLAFPEITLYSVPRSNKKGEGLTPNKNDSTAMKELRELMATEEGQIVYKERPSTAEFANAVTKNLGMRSFLVRGLDKVLSMALMYAITHNMMAFMRLC